MPKTPQGLADFEGVDMRQVTPCDCPDGQCKTCRRRESGRRYNAKRTTIGKPCCRCGKIRDAIDGNHSGYCKDCLRWWRIEREFGLTQDQWETLLHQQDGVCVICDCPSAESHQGMLHVDHDHDTGRIRGLLCHNCNQSLGRWNHDPALLRRAADYLES